MTAPHGIILAGGLATRMGGGDKCLLPLGNARVIDHVIRRIMPQVAGLALNANGDASRFAGILPTILPDSIDGFPGPLAGVLAGLDWAADEGASHIVSVAADTPFFPNDLVQRLQSAIDPDHPIVLAATPHPDRGKTRHPTFGFWPVAPRIAGRVTKGRRMDRPSRRRIRHIRRRSARPVLQHQYPRRSGTGGTTDRGRCLMRIYGIVGWKNAGKTGLMERLVAEITGRGFTVSTLKHAHHSFDVDHQGKDSHRHRIAGATEVLLSSRNRWALMHENRDEPESSLSDLLTRLAPVDLVLVEGYKRDTHPKVEAHRAETGNPLIALADPTVRAIASDTELAHLSIPIFDLNDTSAVADFILSEVGL